MKNFASPYKASSLTEFWRRWHISLSTFLRDYLYIPLGGNRTGAGAHVCQPADGHGARWAVARGQLDVCRLGRAARRRARARTAARARRAVALAAAAAVRWRLTFLIVLAGWVFFRSDTFGVAAHYFQALAGTRGTADTAGLLQADMATPYNMFMLAVGLGISLFVPNSQSLLRVLTPCKVAAAILLFGFAVAMMFTQGFNPFLYFQF